MLGILLEDYTCEVLDKRDLGVQDWDYISPEAVLLEHKGSSEMKKRLKRAIADARFLVSLASGAYQQATPATQSSSSTSSSPHVAADLCVEADFPDLLDGGCWLDDASAVASVAALMPFRKITPRSNSADSPRRCVAVDVAEEDDVSHVDDDIMSIRRIDDAFSEVIQPSSKDHDDEEAPLVSLSPSPSNSPRKDGRPAATQVGAYAAGRHTLASPAFPACFELRPPT